MRSSAVACRLSTAGAVALAALAGGAAASGRGIAIAALLLLVGLGCIIALYRRLGPGFAIAILLLGAVDALPGPNLELTKLPVGLYGTDVVILCLIAVLLYQNSRSNFATLRHTRVGRLTLCWTIALSGWWLFTLARSVLWSGEPLQSGAYYGRDFLYFALVLPLVIEPMRDRHIRTVTLACLAVGVCVITAVQLAANFGHPVSFLFHESGQSLASGSITRVYSAASHMITAAVPLSLGMLVFGPRRGLRVLGAALAVASIAALALSLTRALYVGMIVGLGCAFIVWLVLGGEGSRLVRRQLLKTVAVGGAVIVVLLAYEPAVVSQTAVAGVVQRFTSVFAATASTDPATSTVALREKVDSDLLQLLGPRWPIGLGFLDPKHYYVPGLPSGSIRDSDTGVLNVVMTMGVIGALLLYAPAVMLLFALIAYRLRRRHVSADDWLAFAAVTWIIMALASSVSLVILFSPGGLMVTALVLGLAAATIAPRGESAASSASHGIGRRLARDAPLALPRNPVPGL